MTPTEHKAERDKRLKDAGKIVEAALAPITGSVQFNIKAGRVLNFDVRESVKVLADDAFER